MTRILNTTVIFIAIFLFANRLPVIYNMYKKENTHIAPFIVTGLDKNPINSSDFADKKILIFWATWCGPCEIELNRINTLIKEKKLNRESVLAISNEEIDLLNKFKKQQGYDFPIASDLSGSLFQTLEIPGTPTLIFLKNKNQIEWMTTGISPTLSSRISQFLSN